MKLDDLLNEATDPGSDPGSDLDVDGALADVARRGRRRRHAVATALVASLVTVVATSALVAHHLGSTDEPDAVTMADSGEGTDLPRIWRHDEANPLGMMAIVRGTLTYRPERDCFFLIDEGGIERPVVWPYGTQPTADGPGVVLPDGQVATVGDQVEGGGGYLPGRGFDIPDACRAPDGDAAQLNPTGPIEVTRPEPHISRHEESAGGAGRLAPVQGTLVYWAEADCFLITEPGSISGHPVVWPYGTEATADGPGVVLPDGQVARVGDHVRGSGSYNDDRTTARSYGVPEACQPTGVPLAVFNADGPIEVEPSAP
jgi:hypothetical protein